MCLLVLISVVLKPKRGLPDTPLDPTLASIHERHGYEYCLKYCNRVLDVTSPCLCVFNCTSELQFLNLSVTLVFLYILSDTTGFTVLLIRKSTRQRPSTPACHP